MEEKHHYNGSFIFHYHPTNQGKVIKAFLQDVASDKLKSEARKNPWKSYSTLQKREAIETAEHVIKSSSPELIEAYLDPDRQKVGMDAEQSKQASVSLYHVMNLITKLVTYPADFDIKHDLACRVIKNSFGSVDFEDSI